MPAVAATHPSNPIIDWIRNQGPVSVAAYMRACLEAYYTSQPAIGRAGDFITAPEVSQLFGEVIGAYLIYTWQQLGCPTPVSLIEFGPGRGTLMADILRMAQKHSAFHQALQVHLIEINPHLRADQATALQPFQTNPTWHATIDTLPTDTPWLVVANEFLDALPVQQWVYHHGAWYERSVAWQESQLTFQRATTPMSFSMPYLAPPSEGAILETSPAVESLVTRIAEHLSNQSGLALFIDYGYLKPGYGDTLQSVFQHRFQDVFANPGNADITAHVNFARLYEIAQAHGLDVPVFTTQGDFLTACGILQRAEKLIHAGANPDKIGQAVQRLISPNQMGELFKVIAMHAHR